MRTALVSLIVLFSAARAHAVLIFSQDFNSSAVVSDYVSLLTPNSGQFNAIGSSNGSGVVSITSNALSFARSASPNTMTYSRTTDFAPIPDAIIYQFDLSVSGNSVAQTTAAVFQVGSGYGVTNAAQANADTYARIGINLTANAGEFSLRNISTTTNSTTFTGTQTITWVLNNTGGSFSYTPPGGGSVNIANDTADIYVGTTNVFDDVAVLTVAQVMSDLKFAFTDGLATINIDNININTVPEPSAFALAALALFALPRQRRIV